MKRRGGFSLIEMIVATVLASVLISAELAIFSRISKDRQLITRDDPSRQRGLTDLVSFDLSQAETIETTQPHLLVMVGHSGISADSRSPDQRFVRITYAIVSDNGRSRLVRTQQYLDDPTRPRPWQEWIADGVLSISLHSEGQNPQLVLETGRGSVAVKWHP